MELALNEILHANHDSVIAPYAPIQNALHTTQDITSKMELAFNIILHVHHA